MKQVLIQNLVAFIIFFALLFFCYAADEDVNLNPFDYARITDVDYTAIVQDTPNAGGSVNVTERLKFDIHAFSKNNTFWELWRDLCEDNIDGLDVTYKVNSVKQIMPDGNEVVFSESPKLYWDDYDYINTPGGYGPNKWFHSPGPYNEYYNRYECVFFYVDGLYREKPVYELNYDIHNASLKYADCSELYLALYSEETIKYLNSFKGQILFPNKDMPKTGNYDVHTYGTNSHTFPIEESATQNPGYYTFSFNLDKSDLKFKPVNEYIEFSLVSYGEDKHIFTDYAPNNYYTNENALDEIREDQKEYDSIPLKYFVIKVMIFVGCSFVSILIITLVSHADSLMRKSYNFYEPTMQMDYFREIPSNLDPNFVSTFAFCKDKYKDRTENGYAAALLSLVRKHYIDLVKINSDRDWSFNNTKIVVTQKPIPLIVFPVDSPFENSKELEPLSLSEEYYFNLILRHSNGDEISMKSFQSRVASDYENTDSFVTNMKNSIVDIGISEGYFQKANYESPKNTLMFFVILLAVLGVVLGIFCSLSLAQTYIGFAFGGFFLLGFSLIGSAIYLKRISNKYILLTQLGEDEYVKWNGLYNFLNSETLMNERTVVELPLWEQYLVYATAFGISDKVLAAIKVRCPEMNMSPMISSYSHYHSRCFHVHSHSFSRATHRASHTAHSAHGSGGYGYGGGGRGGGGGRRRSLE